MKVTTILRSVERENSDFNHEEIFKPDVIKNDMKIIGGRAAGICYAPDSYFSVGIHDDDKALTRAKFNCNSGHYSVFEHGHITFMIECSKTIAMVLNSTRLYSTSEKSARYTKMHPETEYERDFFGKWTGIFTKIIPLYENYMTDKEVEKIAMENARYMTSVFTPTTMEYTLPYDRCILLCGWLDKLASDINEIVDPSTTVYNIYFKRLASEAVELANFIRAEIGEDKFEPTLVDHKDIGINFFNEFGPFKDKLSKVCIPWRAESKEYYGDVYVSKYYASFACIAQMQRHRTLPTSIRFYTDELDCFIPKIIKDTIYEKEWVSDFNTLINNGVCPQGVIVEATEKGIFEDFILKCKERLCSRTQYETNQIVKDQVENFYFTNKEEYEINGYNMQILEDMMYLDSKDDIACIEDYKVKTRCKFSGYKCKEVCKHSKSNYCRNF